MRARVLISLVISALIAVTALVAPALSSTSRARTQELILNRSASQERLASLASLAMETGDGASLTRYAERYHDLYGEAVLVFGASGQVIVATGDLSPDDGQVSTLAARAQRNLATRDIPTVMPWSDRYYLLAEPVEGDADFGVGAVVLQVDAQGARSDVRRSWSVILVGGLLVVVALIGLALVMTRWVLRPVRLLDRAATTLAHGEQPRRLAPAGPPELRHLSQSFDEMASTVTAALEQQRQLVADSSHQLRNPLAAMRLRVDSLALGHDEPLPDAQLALLEGVEADLHRLEQIVDGLLRLAEAEHRIASGSRLPAAADAEPELLATDLFPAEVLRRWEPIATAGEVRLVTSGLEHIRLGCAPSDVFDMLDAVVGNAVKYAGSGATVVVRAEAPTPAAYTAVVSVTDDGPGLEPSDLASVGQRFWRSARHAGVHGTGLGLAIVERLAAANGGEMRVSSVDPHGLRVALHLPTGAP